MHRSTAGTLDAGKPRALEMLARGGLVAVNVLRH